MTATLFDNAAGLALSAAFKVPPLTVTVNVSSVVSFNVIEDDPEPVVNVVGDTVVVEDAAVAGLDDFEPVALTCSGNPVTLALAETTKLLPAVTVPVGGVRFNVAAAPVSYIEIELRFVLAPVVSVTAADSWYGSAAPVVVGFASVVNVTEI